MKKLAVLFAAGMVLGSASAFAGAGLTAKVGSLGFGGDLTVGLSPKASLRAGFNFFNYDLDISDETEDEGITGISPEIQWQSIPVTLDWHPWANEWRFSAGIVINNNNVDLSADPDATFEVAGMSFPILDLNGEVTFEQVAPYIGFGYGNAATGPSRWHFAFDAGVMFQGKADVTMDATSAIPQLQPFLDADLREDEQDLEDDLEILAIYPVISFGVSYSF